MTDKELNEILDLIRVNYKNFFKTETASDKATRLKTWRYQFMNIPFEMMFQICMQYMAVEKSFPPSIAHIAEIRDKMIYGETIGAEESFENILTLINRYGSDAHGFKIASKEFGDVERLIVNAGYYKELGQSNDPRSVLKAQFGRMYNNKQESVKHNKRIEPPTVDILKLLSDRKIEG